MLDDKPDIEQDSTIHTSYAAPIYLSSEPQVETRINTVESVIKIHDHLLKLLERFRRESVNHARSLSRDIHLLQKKVASLEEKIENLESIKMDRPSASSELINAERYVDDYFELKNRAEKRQREYTTRIRKKIGAINAPAPNTKKQRRRTNRLLTPTIIVGTITTILNIWLFC